MKITCSCLLHIKDIKCDVYFGKDYLIPCFLWRLKFYKQKTINYCKTIEILKVEVVWRNIDQIESFFFLLLFLKKSGNFLITLTINDWNFLPPNTLDIDKTDNFKLAANSFLQTCKPTNLTVCFDWLFIYLLFTFP